MHKFFIFFVAVIFIFDFQANANDCKFGHAIYALESKHDLVLSSLPIKNGDNRSDAALYIHSPDNSLHIYYLAIQGNAAEFEISPVLSIEGENLFGPKNRDKRFIETKIYTFDRKLKRIRFFPNTDEIAPKYIYIPDLVNNINRLGLSSRTPEDGIFNLISCR